MRYDGNAGFTLVEMSVVLVIIGLLILTVFPALTVSRNASQRSMTQSNLQALMLATASYVQANGCVPCPMPPALSGAGFGRVRGDTLPAACNNCAVAEGIPPFVSLGVSANIARDGWGHWITMRVDPVLIAPAFTAVVPPTGPTGMCQANLSANNRVNITTPGGATQQAAVLFLSHGAKGYGSFLADAQPFLTRINIGCRLNFPDLPSTCTQSLSCNSPSTGPAYSKCNAAGANQFYNASAQEGYDDMMVFAGRNMLVSMLGNGSACTTN